MSGIASMADVLALEKERGESLPNSTYQMIGAAAHSHPDAPALSFFIAMRTHANEVANAWSAGQFLGDGISAGKTIFCGLPLFHVNGVLVTGLLPFSRGAHVILQ